MTNKHMHMFNIFDLLLSQYTYTSTQHSDEYIIDKGHNGPTVPKNVVEMWESLSPEVRNALIAAELKVDSSSKHKQQRDRSESSTPTVLSRSSSELFFGEQNSSCESSSYKEDSSLQREKCPVSGATVILTPVERAPKNVFAFTKTQSLEKSEVVKTSSATVTTTTKVVSTSRGWRNVFSLPISYDVNMVAHGTLFDSVNSQLLDATGVHPEGYNTRFAVVDTEVEALYGDKIRMYFEEKGIELTVCVINGGEADKRSEVRFCCLYMLIHNYCCPTLFLVLLVKLLAIFLTCLLSKQTIYRL